MHLHRLLPAFCLGLSLLSPPASAKTHHAAKVHRTAADDAARAVVKRTVRLLRVAAAAAKRGHKGQADLRTALVQQRAARRALKDHHPAVADQLTLAARRSLRAVLRANGRKLPKPAPDEASAAAAAATAVQADADLALRDAETEVPADVGKAAAAEIRAKI
jgi:hypothetical protein